MAAYRNPVNSIQYPGYRSTVLGAENTAENKKARGTYLLRTLCTDLWKAQRNNSKKPEIVANSNV